MEDSGLAALKDCTDGGSCAVRSTNFVQREGSFDEMSSSGVGKICPTLELLLLKLIDLSGRTV